MAPATKAARPWRRPGENCWPRRRTLSLPSRNSSPTARSVPWCAGATTGARGMCAAWTSSGSETAASPKAWPTSRDSGTTVRDRPDVCYAHNGEVAIAYQVFGEGPINLVCVPGFVSNLHWNWELPEYQRMLTGLGSFARVAILDRRGVGLSDRLHPRDLPSLEVMMDDILTVMDDAGIDRAAAFGWQNGATLAALLASTYPDRVSQLVTFNFDPCPLLKPDWPHGLS